MILNLGLITASS